MHDGPPMALDAALAMVFSNTDTYASELVSFRKPQVLSTLVDGIQDNVLRLSKVKLLLHLLLILPKF